MDLLIVQEMGKNISGTGMDTNIVGMWRRNGGPREPDFRVLAVLDLTPDSYGNASGVGLADLITERLRAKIDWHATYTNCLTAGNFAAAKQPVSLTSDREVIETGLMGKDAGTARVVWIQNTLELETLWLSPALLGRSRQVADAHAGRAGAASPVHRRRCVARAGLRTDGFLNSQKTIHGHSRLLNRGLAKNSILRFVPLIFIVLLEILPSSPLWQQNGIPRTTNGHYPTCIAVLRCSAPLNRASLGRAGFQAAAMAAVRQLSTTVAQVRIRLICLCGISHAHAASGRRPLDSDLLHPLQP